MTLNGIQTRPESRDPTQALLNLLRTLVVELHPKRRLAERVELDASLERDLAIDSLARVELLFRIEQLFQVTLPEQLFMSSETPRGLLRLINSAAPATGRTPPVAPRPVTQKETTDLPHSAQTLTEVLLWHAERHRERGYIHFYQEKDSEEKEISYGRLLSESLLIASGLRQRQLLPGQAVAIMLPTCSDYFFAFFGVLLAGGIPVPIYPPTRMSQIERHLTRHLSILDNAQAALLITVAEAKPLSHLIRPRLERLRQIVTPQELRENASGAKGAARTQPQDIAFLQYTSGSTGNPKGVVLTHANLLANIRAMGAAIRVAPSDVFVSWLPLYHDMGLIGACLGALYYALPLVLMSPLTFLARPQHWLWAIHHHRGTLSAAPNFAYELCLLKVREESIQGLDLSSWRMAFNGAEPVSARTITAFQQRFEPYGFRRETMAPVYGLAESSVGLAFPPLGRAPIIQHIRRDDLEQSGRALPADEGDRTALELVSCGQPLPGHQIRIVDALGRELPEQREGRLQFRGPSTTSGYFRNPEQTRTLFDGEWLESGDLAFLSQGEVFLTSRIKDLIIRAGRNIYPYEVEQAVGDLEGVRKGCVAVFGSADPGSQTERLVILAETRRKEIQEREALQQQITQLTTDILGTPPDEVVLANPHTVLKTSSGKIRRAACKRFYEEGAVDAKSKPPWLQLTQLAINTLIPRLRRGWRLFLDTLFSAYLWLVFLLLAVPSWFLVVLLPRPAWRWVLMNRAIGLLLRLSGTPLAVHGLEHLPADRPYLLVANHSSYLDGIILIKTLPTRLRYVAKAELFSSFISRLFLSRIGAEFVERFDVQKGIADTQRLKERACSGDPMLFFPEGTFRRMPGLLPFRMGAFITAAQADIPVVPVTLRGTRSILRAGSWFPHRGALQLFIGQPVAPEGDDWEAAIRLRDRCREEMLRRCGEPDLGDDQC